MNRLGREDSRPVEKNGKFDYKDRTKESKRMKGKHILYGILLLAIGGLAFLTFSHQPAQEGTSPTEEATQDVEESTPAQSYSLEEVADHSTREDCWLVIDGRVFDVTRFIPAHPGREAIIEGCGKDATELFETRPMGSGTAHSSRARNIRENYYIGDLAE